MVDIFRHYEIKSIGYDEVIYLFLDLSYEFALDITSDSTNYSLTRRCKNFLDNNYINFNGNKIFLVINNIIVKSLDLRSLTN